MRNQYTFVAAGILGVALAACGGTSEPEMGTATDAAAAPESAAATPAEAGLPVQEPGADAADAADGEEADQAPPAFDIAQVPVSEVALGEFPYLRLPTNYVYQKRVESDYDRAAYWTGDRLEWVEGRVGGGRVTGDKAAGKKFALLEFQRNMQAAIREAGGQSIAQGRWPRELRDELKQTDPDLGVRLYGALGDIWNDAVETFVIRRPDRVIWVQMTGSQSSGNLLITETAEVEITAGLLEAAVLQQQLDADGRVAIQVNFAVDKADILPDSEPQIAQVLALLADDPSLRLSIDGHTDASGDAAHNQRLSEARAQAVVASLVAQGIDGSRLEAKGYGPVQPVADNTSEEGRARNRRVELVRLD